jgi:hypothetical protein
MEWERNGSVPLFSLSLCLSVRLIHFFKFSMGNQNTRGTTLQHKKIGRETLFPKTNGHIYIIRIPFPLF